MSTRGEETEAGGALCWVAMEKRKPTREDCDERLRVVVYHIYNGTMVARLENALDNRFISHWMRMPPLPGKSYTEIRVEQEKLLEEKERKEQARKISRLREEPRGNVREIRAETDDGQIAMDL